MGKKSEKEYIYVCKLNHFVVHLKHYKLTVLQLKNIMHILTI